MASTPQLPLSTDPEAMEAVAGLIDRARRAQQAIEGFSQERIDELTLAIGWAIMEPARNRVLAEMAVRDTGLGNAEDKVAKNYRKTLGLLRDLQGRRTVGVIAEKPEQGLIEIARPAGVVAAVTPSTNPGATPANKIINAVKCRNAVIVAPSPKGASTCAQLLKYVHAELERVGLDAEVARDLVQMLPTPVSKSLTHALMMQADLVVATGSQANVRAAYLSGTPAFGVGAGNVASIVDASADVAAAAAKIMQSKTFDNATSCSSENSVVLVEPIADAMLEALAREGAVLLDASDKERLQKTMWPGGRLSADVTARAAGEIAEIAKLEAPATRQARALLVEETGTGPQYPYSGEKLSPVLTVYRAKSLEDAARIVTDIYAFQGAGHSVSLHAQGQAASEGALKIGLTMPVARVIVNQPHAIATGGNFDNGLPFSLSMGCGTWGGNNFSSNMDVSNYMNITRIAYPIAPRMPSDTDIFGTFFDKFGR
jgi:sulfoacetaldehyde dehydrogenase